MRHVKDWVDPRDGAIIVSCAGPTTLLVYGFDENELEVLSALEEIGGVEVVVAAHDPDLIALPAFAALIKEGAHTAAALELIAEYLEEISEPDSCPYYLVRQSDNQWQATALNAPASTGNDDLLSVVKKLHRSRPLQ